MKIPSYDDLTRPIPDVEPADVFGSVDRVMPRSAPVGVGGERTRRTPLFGRRIELYAALQGESADTLVTIARDFSPRIQRHGSNTVVLDVSGLGQLLGDPVTIAAELARAGASRVAIAPSQIAARLLARARSGVSVVTGDLEPALSRIPLSVLGELVADAGSPVIVTQPSPFDVMARWGLKTLGELATLPAVELSARLGQGGIRLQQLARGVDADPLVPDPGGVRFVESIELEWPIDALEPLSFVFARLLEPLSAALEGADRGAAAVRVDLRLTDRTVHTRVLQLPAPMRDPRVLRTLLLLDLEWHHPAAPIDVVTIEVDPAPARIVQYSLLERALPSPETIATLTARLEALVGADRCGSAVRLDTHRPDAFRMVPFTQSAALQRRVSGADAQLKLRASAFAEAPADKTGVLRRFRPPVAVRVTLARGRPVRMAIDRQGMPGGTVVQAAGPWRTSGGWWGDTPWDRDEWDVAFRNGAACRISHDRLSGVWFLEGVFD
jgi:protein ImuB